MLQGLVDYDSDSDESSSGETPQVNGKITKDPNALPLKDSNTNNTTTTTDGKALSDSTEGSNPANLSQDELLPSERHANSDQRSPFLEQETKESWREHYEDSDQELTVTKEDVEVPRKFKNAKRFAAFIQKHSRVLSLDDMLPPEPVEEEGASGLQGKQITQKVQFLMDRKEQTGLSLVNDIEGRKSFKNPSIYQKLIKSFDINESGSNFPTNDELNIEEYDKDCYYDSLRDTQMKHAEELEKKRNRLNAKKEAAMRSRKTKWDK